MSDQKAEFEKTRYEENVKVHKVQWLLLTLYPFYNCLLFFSKLTTSPSRITCFRFLSAPTMSLSHQFLYQYLYFLVFIYLLIYICTYIFNEIHIQILQKGLIIIITIIIIQVPSVGQLILNVNDIYLDFDTKFWSNLFKLLFSYILFPGVEP